MTSYSGTILFENEFKEALLTLGYAPTFGAVQTLAGVLHQYSTATIKRCTFTQAVDPKLTGSGAEISDTGFAAHFKFRRIDPDADVRFKDFRMPAPKNEIFEAVPGSGYRIKPDVGAAMAAAYSEFAGEEFIYDSGWLVN